MQQVLVEIGPSSSATWYRQAIRFNAINIEEMERITVRQDPRHSHRPQRLRKLVQRGSASGCNPRWLCCSQCWNSDTTHRIISNLMRVLRGFAMFRQACH